MALSSHMLEKVWVDFGTRDAGLEAKSLRIKLKLNRYVPEFMLLCSSMQSARLCLLWTRSKGLANGIDEDKDHGEVAR